MVAKQQAKDKEEELKREKKEAKDARKKADPYKGMSRQEKRKRMLRDEHAKEVENMRKDLEREYKDLDPQVCAVCPLVTNSSRCFQRWIATTNLENVRVFCCCCVCSKKTSPHRRAHGRSGRSCPRMPRA